MTWPPVELLHEQRAGNGFEFVGLVGQFMGYHGLSLFRGVGARTHGLVPKALRAAGHGGLDDARRDRQRSYEMTLLIEFAWAADRAGLVLPRGMSPAEVATIATDRGRWGSRWHSNALSPVDGGLPSTPDDFAAYPLPLVELAALAQHHGVPTRLLDVTFNRYVAAWFAASAAVAAVDRNESSPDDVFGVWMIPPGYYAARAHSTPQPDPNAAQHGDDQPVHLVTVSRGANRRLHAQAGAFLMKHPTRLTANGGNDAWFAEPRDLVEVWRDTPESRPRRSIRFVCAPVSAAADALHHLDERYLLSESTIYGDFGAAAKEAISRVETHFRAIKPRADDQESDHK